jgi:phosphoribosylanthranilate isomerase
MQGIMPSPIVQIYEIQTPDEARAMIDLGVDHIGSVVTSRDSRHDPILRETVSVVREMGSVSSLIPLYTDPDAVLDTLDHLRPHIVHFCDKLDGSGGISVDAALQLQSAVKRRFPAMHIMRSIPIAQAGWADAEAVLALAARLEPLSDYFLTDTVVMGDSGASDADQPVNGFVGITGLTCDWSVAAQLVAISRIPVILAGGISPQNVADGIRQVRPFGVDSCTCTNVVGEDGRPIRFKKDVGRVARLVAEARKADGLAAIRDP